jgi:DNA (cytosine-5)-methyltransferase 1
MDKKNKNVWDKSIEVESNQYNWSGEPFISKSRKVNKSKFVHIDLFSGCGGFSVGFEQAGFTTELAVDIHPPSLETLQLNHQYATTICGDIRNISSKLIKNNIINLHVPKVITAGVPCQGFSLSNRKRHGDDKRNFLFREFIRIAKDLKPDVVVLENVSGLVSTKDGEFKNAIAEAIENLGYDVHFSMLNAADYGVPQKRRRIFFVGVPKGMAWFFPFKTHGINEVPYNTVGDAILGDLPKLGSGEEAETYLGQPKTELQKYLRGSTNTLTNHQAPSHPQETINKIKNTKPGEPMYDQFKQRIRLHPDQPSPTQVCGGIRPQFQFGHPTQPRGLSIRERARLQSFPDNYIFTGGLVQGRVQTGNAVAPMIAKAIGLQIKNLLNGQKLKGIASEAIQKDFFD